ncbi:MAG: acyltransferase family protein [Tepidisphaeraceae bacterium]
MSASAIPAAQFPARPSDIDAPPRLSRAHVPALDGLRGIAVLLVIFFHFMVFLTDANGVFERGLQKVAGLGWTGVDLFFVLSGFLITGILYDSKDSRHYFRNFYARRTARIFPLYYAFLLIMLVILPLFGRQVADFFQHVPWKTWPYWAYLSNFAKAYRWGQYLPPDTECLGITWSLAIEEQFYLVWPAIVLAFSRKTLLRMCLGLIGMSVLLRGWWVIWNPENANMAYVTFLRLDPLAVGAAISLLLRGPLGLTPHRRLAARIAGAAPIALVTINVTTGALLYSPLFRVVGFTIVALFYGAILVLLLTAMPTNAAPRFFSSQPMRMFGKFSYAMYLFNQPVKYLLVATPLNPQRVGMVFGSQLPALMLFFAVGLACTTVAAWVSWNVLEKHFLRLKDLFPMEEDRKVTQPALAQALGGAAPPGTAS